MVDSAFDVGGPWDFVVNLAGETKYSQTEEVIVFHLLSLNIVRLSNDRLYNIESKNVE